MRRAVLLLAIVAACAVLVFARDTQSEPPQPTALAVVEGKTLTTADVEARGAGQLAEIRAQEQKLREALLNDLIDEAVIEKAASARGQTVSEYLRVEVDQKVIVSEDEKKATLERYRSELGGMSEQEALGRIDQALRQQQADEMRQSLAARLRGTANVKMLFEPARVEVDVPAGAPARGPSDAPVTIVEFSDFQCPFCSRANTTIEQVLRHYGDRVRLVFRDYPLPMHAEAPKAHEAGRCAGEQGKFWPMHDRMFADQAALGVESLKKSAAAIGLDQARFDACLDSGKLAGAVQSDMAAGQTFGVTGTPAFFINGRMISGALPFASFSRLIDDELQRKGVARPAPAAQ